MGKGLANATDLLRNNSSIIVTVSEWASLIGYNSLASFSEDFRKEFGRRPQPVLLAYRVKKTLSLVRKGKFSNYEIARKMQFPNEQSLYQFIKTQTGFSPTEIENLDICNYSKVVKEIEEDII